MVAGHSSTPPHGCAVVCKNFKLLDWLKGKPHVNHHPHMSRHTPMLLSQQTSTTSSPPGLRRRQGGKVQALKLRSQRVLGREGARSVFLVCPFGCGSTNWNSKMGCPGKTWIKTCGLPPLLNFEPRPPIYDPLMPTSERKKTHLN